MPSARASSIVIFATHQVDRGDYIAVSFMTESGTILEQLKLGSDEEWDVANMGMIVRKLVMQQIALWKPLGV